jgi:hypothetical protein
MCHKAATAKRRLFEKPRQRAGMVEMEMRNLEHYNNTYAKKSKQIPTSNISNSSQSTRSKNGSESTPVKPGCMPQSNWKTIKIFTPKHLKNLETHQNFLVLELQKYTRSTHFLTGTTESNKTILVAQKKTHSGLMISLSSSSLSTTIADAAVDADCALPF